MIVVLQKYITISHKMTISNVLVDMNEKYDEIDELCDHIHDMYVDTDEDWGDIKHMPIDNVCMSMNLDDIKNIVKTYGVLEIMDIIKGNYGDEHITAIMEKTMDMRYRCLLYHILDEYIDYVKDTYHWRAEDEEDEEDDEDDEEVDSDTASSADTDEEN